ncbi:MAG: hypothetical protein LQ351_003873 [Letrouitia transgressa]|nr:MAG: hypothetical protein LQ351_003873 [Letrouitia transgressa]
MATLGGRYVGTYTGLMSDHIAAATAVASETLSNIALVHAFGANRRLEHKFTSSLGRARREGIKRAAVAAVQAGLLFFIAYSANALAFWQGSRTAAAAAATTSGEDSGITVGAVYTVIFLLVDGKQPLVFGATVAAVEKMQNIVGRASNIDGTSTTKGTAFFPIVGHLEFRNVTFTYPSRPSREVLRDVSMDFPAGKHTAIVGVSGSGKSTIASLASRLYDPSQGSIYLDGHDIRDINVQHLRRHIGTVQQEAWLLDRSVLETIAHGLVNSAGELKELYERTLLGPGLLDLTRAVREGLPFKDAVSVQGAIVSQIVDLVRSAAVRANADDFICNLEHGYATLVGPGGAQLSGGQRQKLAFARALIKNPVILIFDEATSSLDSTSERKIQASIQDVLSSRTTISIAHRLSTIKGADNIIVFREGRLVEQGTHSSLLAQNSYYAEMVQTQALQSTLVPSADEALDSDGVSTSNASEKDSSTYNGRIRERQKSMSGHGCAEETHDQQDLEMRSRSVLSTVRGIAVLLRPQLVLVFFGIFASIVVGGSYSGDAVIFGHTIGSLSPCRGSQSILASGKLFGLLFFILALVTLAATFVSGTSFGAVSERLIHRVRVLAFRTLLGQDVCWHVSGGRSPGTLLSYISRDANAMASLTGTVTGTIFAILTNLFVGILLTHIIAWKIAIVLIATLPLLLGSGFMRLRVLAQLQTRHQVAYATSIGITVEAVSSIKTVASLGLEAEFCKVYSRSLGGPYRASIRAISYANFWLATAFSVSNLIYALAYWWGSKQIIEGFYSQTQFFIVLPALLFSAQSCGQMFALAPDLSNARVASAKILNLLDISSTKEQASASVAVKQLSNEEKHDKDLEFGDPCSIPHIKNIGRVASKVMFRDVYFSYPARPQIEILHGLDLNILPGKFYALVGPSGAGKSTIMSLIEKFFQPTSGRVEIDGKDLVDTEADLLRERISLVPQDSVLFDDTISFNIGLGARRDCEATEVEITEACQLANIHDMIAGLPHGYKTRCGPSGNQFSGGQKQRLSIARALLRQPSLLLLDEPTSALDAESEIQFQDTLDKILRRKDMTVLAVAHRLHTIQKAERIFLIDNGRCVDQGTHEELFQRSAFFRSSVLHQALD